MRTRRLTAFMLTAITVAGVTLSGCGTGINESATFATLDGNPITMGVANVMAKYQQATYDSFYMSMFGENMWQNDLYGNGNTLEVDVKNEVAEDIEEAYLLEQHMEEYGVTITEEDMQAMDKAAEQFLADNSEKAVKQMGASNKENVIEMLRLKTIVSKMHDRIIKDADTNVSDEEAAQRGFSYVKFATDGHYEGDTMVEYTEDEKAAMKATAESIAEADDFDAAVEAAGQTVSTGSYGSAEDEDSNYDTEVLEAADKLKEGQVSGVVETETGYYVIRLDKEFDEEATNEKKEELISQKQEDYYTDIVDGWKDKAEWEINEKEWAKVTFTDHFTAVAEDTETESIEDTEVQ